MDDFLADLSSVAGDLAFAEALREQHRQLQFERKQRHRGARELQDEIAELRLMLAATVQLLIRSKTITPEDLQDLASQLDAKDGEPDGRLRCTINLDGTLRPPPASPLEDLANQLGY